MNKLQDYIFNLLPSHKMKKNGEVIFNCPTCYHTESRPDSRKRGHITFTDDGFIYHCFNCHFSCGWSIGSNMSKHMWQFLVDLGFSIKQIYEVKDIIAELNGTNTGKKEIKVEKRIFRDIPNGYKNIKQSIINQEFTPTLISIQNYLKNRNENLINYIDLMWKDGLESFLIPCYENEKVVGYSLRNINPNAKSKYVHYIPSGYIYNYDSLFDDKKYVIIVEGALDASCIDGISFLTNSFPEDKLKRFLPHIKDKEVILVPDKDDGGKKFVEEMFKKKLNFSVSFPSWDVGIKDVEEATRKYGRLWVLDNIIKNKENDAMKIKLKLNTF